MYFTEPSYADGIGKGKQTKFGGLNHNEGAGDGELFAMKNLCSDYYPMIATRKKRRKLRTLTKPNGIYAWEKLCWVDGTTFYYDGVAKGTVEDSRKQFAAINDIIIIMPDKKYYDTAEDRFGDLEAEVGAQSTGEALIIDTTPTETETVRSGKVPITVWNNWARGGWNGQTDTGSETLAGDITEMTVENDRITGEHLIIKPGIENYIGQYVYICNVDSQKNCGPKKLTGVSRSEGWMQFESGSLEDGSFHPRFGSNADIDNAGNNMVHIEIRRCYLTPVRFGTTSRIIGNTVNPDNSTTPILEYVGTIQLSTNTGQLNEDTKLVNWSYLFGSNSVIDIETGEERFEDAETKGTDTGLLYIAENPYGETTVIEDLVTITVNRIPNIIFQDGTLNDEPAEANTIYCEGIDWAEYAVPGDSIRIIGNSMGTVSEPVSNDGTYRIREVDGHELRFAAGSFTNGTDTSTREYYLRQDGIHFEITHPGAAFFESSSIHCRLDGEDWTEQIEAGELVKITDCSEEGNNKTLMLRSVEEQDLGFDEGSFTEIIDADGFTITRIHQHPVEFRDGTLYGEPAEANTVYCNSVIWSDYFRVGDTITITGCTIPLNNQTLIIRELDGHEMRFYENTFNEGIDTGDTILIKRNLPDLECVFENDNRLWGYADKAIYASKLGDPFNFYVYDGLDTDSYAVDTGSPGNFTGGWSYMGYPTFLKGRNVYKVYGNKPSNYEVMNAATLGLMSGGGKSLAIAGETLFYLGECGIIMYTGGIPTPINRAFGQERYRNAVAGSDGLKYYVSMEDRQGTWHLFVYDTQKGMWHEEDNTEAVGFAYLDGQLYMLDSEGNFTTEGYVREEAGEEEEDFEWYAEFTDFTDDSPNKKEVHKVQIRIDLEEDATCRVKLQMDGDGEWIVPQDGVIEGGSKRSYTLAIVPRRADFYKLRLEGQGGCKIYSIARQYSEGSELKSRPGRQ